MDSGTAIVQGTMDLLVLKVLSVEPMHGCGISERIATFSGGTGMFEHFSGTVTITFLSPRNWAWDGTYSFGNSGQGN